MSVLCLLIVVEMLILVNNGVLICGKMVLNDEILGYLDVWKVGKWVESVFMDWYSFPTVKSLHCEQ